MKWTLACALVAGLLTLPCDAKAAQFFFDNFDSYASDGDVTATGWSFVDANSPLENATWTIGNPGGRANPPTANGTPSSGKFLISDSDAADGGNTPDSGMSHDLWSPSFSTVGSAGDVWMHFDTSAVLNNNGAAIFDVDVSTNGGADWTNVFRRVAPGRAFQGATTLLPDTSNANGYYGRLSVNLGAVGGLTDVKTRIRQTEPNDDWWIAIDNVVIDDVAPRTVGGAVSIFAEDFSGIVDGSVGSMLVDTITSGGLETWSTLDGTADKERYFPGQVNPGNARDGRTVNRLMHPAPKSGRTSSQLEFAMIDSDRFGQTVDDYLMTPVLDLSGMGEVFLSFDSEGTQPDNSMEVLLMQDLGNDGPGRGDAVVAKIFDYKASLHDPGEDPSYAQRLFSVPEAAGLSNAFFAFRWSGADDYWWAIDNVAVTGNPGNPIPEPTAAWLAAFGLLATLRKRNR